MNTHNPLRCSPATAQLLGAERRVVDPGVFPRLMSGGLQKDNPGQVVILAFDHSIWLWRRFPDTKP